MAWSLSKIGEMGSGEGALQQVQNHGIDSAKPRMGRIGLRESELREPAKKRGAVAVSSCPLLALEGRPLGGHSKSENEIPTKDVRLAWHFDPRKHAGNTRRCMRATFARFVIDCK